MCKHALIMNCCERNFLRTQRWRWQLSESWKSAKMVFVLSFVISTWAIVAALAGPIAVPAPFPGGKTSSLRLFGFFLKFLSNSPHCCYLVSFANSFSLSSPIRKYENNPGKIYISLSYKKSSLKQFLPTSVLSPNGPIKTSFEAAAADAKWRTNPNRVSTKTLCNTQDIKYL